MGTFRCDIHTRYDTREGVIYHGFGGSKYILGRVVEINVYMNFFHFLHSQYKSHAIAHHNKYYLETIVTIVTIVTTKLYG
jgi:hypothetical protein